MDAISVSVLFGVISDEDGNHMVDEVIVPTVACEAVH